MSNKWIQGAIKHPGALKKTLHIKEGEKIPEAKLKKAEHSKNPTTDSYVVTVGTTDRTFNAVFKNENLKLIPNNYDVSISSKGISKLSAANLTYWIAIEANSSFA